MWIGFALTALGATFAVVSSFISYHSSNITQAEADARIAEAASIARQATIDVAKANEISAKAGERAAALEREAASLRAQAEADRLARIKIEEKLAPRILSGDQQQAIIDAIKPFAPQKFRFVSYQDDQEVLGLVRQLASVLIAAGWKGEVPKSFLLAQLELGVRIEYSPDRSTELSQVAKALSDALDAAGLRTHHGARDKLESTDVLIIRVGKKP